jgi:RNA polymerase sigma-70 factor (ECF subfamily)
MSIKDLADKVISSDKVAFNKLFELLWEDIYTFAKSLLMDEDLAKDIVQDVWINYWERRDKVKNDDIKAYLFQATRFKIYNYFRDNKLNKIQLSVVQELSEPSQIDSEHDLIHTTFSLNNAINKLSPKCKKVFQLSRDGGFNNHEISSQLGISSRTVENQLSLALRKIKEDLKTV